MLTIKKRSGEPVEFDKKKLEQSIRNAGASEKTARSIAEAIKHRDGLTTSDLRTRVIAELKRQAPESGKRYEAFRKPAPPKK